MVFCFHNFYDLNSGAILALPHQPSLNTYYKHGFAKCHIPHVHIDLIYGIYMVQNKRVDHISGNISFSYCGNLFWTLYNDKTKLLYQNPSTRFEFLDKNLTFWPLFDLYLTFNDRLILLFFTIIFQIKEKIKPDMLVHHLLHYDLWN